MTNSPTQGRPLTTNAPPWEHNTRQMLGREGTRDTCNYWLSYYLTNQVNSQSLMLSTDEIQFTLNLMMTTTQYDKTSLTVNNIPIKDYNHLDNHIPIIIIIYNIIYCLSLWTKCWERKPSNKLCISSFKLWRGSGGRGVLIPHSPSFLLWNVCCLHPLTCGRHGEYRRLNSRHSNVVWWHHLLVWIWKVFSDWLLCFQIRKPFVIGWTS